MSMYLHDNRLKSYTAKKMKWPYKISDGYKANPETLSHAGFYFNPSKTSPDNVTCFLCHKSMEGWSPNDDPFNEHISHAPDCAWAICRCVKREFDNNELPFSWDNEDQWPTSKRMEEIRLKTFSNWWPHEGKKSWVGTSRKMAKAGFYFAPTYASEDNVTCMYCDVGLEGWEPKDDPMYEHRKRIPYCPFFAKPPPKLKKGNSATASTTNKKSRRNKKIIQDGIEVVDLTIGSPRVKKNRRLNVIVGEVKANKGKQVYDFKINERINESPHMININEERIDGPPSVININEEVIDEPPNAININEERIDEPSNVMNINEERFDESPNIISISKEVINESPNIISINNEPPEIININVDEPLNTTSIDESRIDESPNIIINMNEEVIDEPSKIVSMNVDEPLNITSTDENEIVESSNINNTNEEVIDEIVSMDVDEPLNITCINENEIVESPDINEEVIDELSKIVSMDVDEPLNITSINDNGIDEPSNNNNITEESIDEPQNITGVNEKRIDELPNIISINGIDGRVEFTKKSEELDGQIDKVESNEEEINELPNNTSINKGWVDEQVNNNSTGEDVQIFNVQTRIIEQVKNVQINKEEIVGLINNDRTKGDESVEQVYNVKSNEGFDKLANHIKTREEIKEKSMIFSNGEGTNEKLNNISINEERNDTLTCQEEPNSIIMDEEELNDIIIDEPKNIFFTAVEKRENVIVNKEEQNNVIDEKERITNEKYITENEEELNIVVNKEPNNMITDEKELNIIMDEEKLGIIGKEVLNVIDEELKEESDINMQIDNVQTKRIDGQVNNIKPNEEIYIITNEKTRENLNNEEKLDEQSNSFGRNEERIEQLNSFTNERRNEQVEYFETKEKNKKEKSLKPIPSENKSESYEVNKSNDVESISPIQAIMSDIDPSENKNEKIIQISVTPNVPVSSEGLKEIQPKLYHTPVSSIPQQYISTPNLNVNEAISPAFITPTTFTVPKRKAAFTVDDYLQSLMGTQNMKLTKKTDRKIESLIKSVDISIEIIMKIPLV